MRCIIYMYRKTSDFNTAMPNYYSINHSTNHYYTYHDSTEWGVHQDTR